VAVGFEQEASWTHGVSFSMQIVDDLKELFGTFSMADISNPSTPEQWLTSMFVLGLAVFVGWALLKLVTGGFG
jgi:hypothetical protein